MLVWLDADTDVAAHPNENYARELMELFTLGIGNYTEQDMREAARAFTGWSFDRTTLAFTERNRLHDGGDKTLLGQTGSFDGTDTIRLATTSPAAARFVAARIWSRYATAITPADPVAADLAATWQSERRGDAMLQRGLHPSAVPDGRRSGRSGQATDRMGHRRVAVARSDGRHVWSRRSQGCGRHPYRARRARPDPVPTALCRWMAG